jgi:hypothetical protein
MSVATRKYMITNPKPLENSPVWDDLPDTFETVKANNTGTKAIFKWVGDKPLSLPAGTELTHDEMIDSLNAVEWERVDPLA